MPRRCDLEIVAGQHLGGARGVRWEESCPAAPSRAGDVTGQAGVRLSHAPGSCHLLRSVQAAHARAAGASKVAANQVLPSPPDPHERGRARRM